MTSLNTCLSNIYWLMVSVDFLRLKCVSPKRFFFLITSHICIQAKADVQLKMMIYVKLESLQRKIFTSKGGQRLRKYLQKKISLNFQFCHQNHDSTLERGKTTKFLKQISKL